MTALIPTVGRFANVDARDLLDDFRRGAPRQAIEIIETEYSGPTESAGSCIGAISLVSTAMGQTAYDYALSTAENHLTAAIEALCCSGADWQLLSQQSTERGYLHTFAMVI